MVLATAVAKRGSATSAAKFSSPTQRGESGGSQSAKASSAAASIGIDLERDQADQPRGDEEVEPAFARAGHRPLATAPDGPARAGHRPWDAAPQGHGARSAASASFAAASIWASASGIGERPGIHLREQVDRPVVGVARAGGVRPEDLARPPSPRGSRPGSPARARCR